VADVSLIFLKTEEPIFNRLGCGVLNRAGNRTVIYASQPGFGDPGNSLFFG